MFGDVNELRATFKLGVTLFERNVEEIMASTSLTEELDRKLSQFSGGEADLDNGCFVSCSRHVD